jgi:hypothetical protein
MHAPDSMSRDASSPLQGTAKPLLQHSETELDQRKGELALKSTFSEKSLRAPGSMLVWIQISVDGTTSHAPSLHVLKMTLQSRSSHMLGASETSSIHAGPPPFARLTSASLICTCSVEHAGGLIS